MDTDDSRPGAEPSVETGVDWRTQLPPDSRQRIVNKIMETLKRHIPYSGQEGLEELTKIAVHFEEKIYTAAMSQSDYLQKISLKMLTLESKSQNTIPNSMPTNPSGSNNIPTDSGVSVWRPNAAHGAEPSVETGGDWRAQLPHGSRQRIVNKIMDTLKRHLPYSGQEELTKIAVRFEEKIYTAAMSQSDYLRKISLKLLTLDKSQNSVPNSMPPNPSGNNNIPPDAGVFVWGPNAAQGARAIQRQRRMLKQQNDLQNLQQQQQPQQQQQLQHLMALQSNLPSMHQQQLCSQSNVSGLQQQQQLLGTQPGNSTMQTNQPSLHLLQRPMVMLQQQTQQNSFLELGCI